MIEQADSQIGETVSQIKQAGYQFNETASKMGETASQIGETLKGTIKQTQDIAMSFQKDLLIFLLKQM